MNKVSIITRTKNRPLLLTRALESIAGQTFNDYIWIIVNDAGEKLAVDQIMEQAVSRGLNCRVIHRRTSSGMEAASNHGIRESESEFIAIHDDDDTWEATFLEQTVDFLQNREEYLGVITHSMKVDEELTGTGAKEIARYPYNTWMFSVQFAEMSLKNQFAPISLLVRRSAVNELNGFDETLPVLGDWDFHLRLLLMGDIGVIPETLANYHFRINLAERNEIYGNTVTSGIDKHVEFDAKYRNRKLREDLANGKPGLGQILFMGRMNLQITDRMNAINEFTAGIQKVLRKVPLARTIRKKLSASR